VCVCVCARACVCVDETDVTHGQTTEHVGFRQPNTALVCPTYSDHDAVVTSTTSAPGGGALFISCSEVDSPAESETDRKEDDWSYPDEDKALLRERRDSGVGSSLTRSSPSRLASLGLFFSRAFGQQQQVWYNRTECRGYMVHDHCR
jgi:hypothetical protein